MRGHLLLAEIEEKQEVYCPFIKREGRGDRDQKENMEEEEEVEVLDDDEDEDGEDSQMAFR